MTKEEMLKQLKYDRDLCNFNPSTGESEPISEDCRKSAEALDMAIKLIEQQPCDDCVSRQAVLETIEDCNSDGLKGIFCSYNDGERFKKYIKKLPPVTPTQCIATIRFSKEDLRDICNERIETECTHGTCKNCRNACESNYNKCIYCSLIERNCNEDFYCKEYKKRGDLDGSN